MMDQIGDGDGVPKVGHFRDILANIVVQRQLPFDGEPLYGRRGKLLGDGRDMEERTRGDGEIVFQIGHAISSFINDLAVFYNGQRTTGGIRLIPSIKDAVDPLGKFFIGLRYRHGGDQEEASKSQ
jgi:hypothetical protein